MSCSTVHRRSTRTALSGATPMADPVMGPMMMLWSHCNTARSIQIANTINLAATKTAYKGVYTLANVLPQDEQGACSCSPPWPPFFDGMQHPTNALLLPTTESSCAVVKPPAEGGALGERAAYEVLRAVLLQRLIPAQAAAAVRPAPAVRLPQRLLGLQHLQSCGSP